MPRDVWLYRSRRQEGKLAPTVQGLHDDSESFQAVLMQVGGSLRSGWAEFSGVPDDLDGWWICVPRVDLLADGDLYSFQLIGCRVVRSLGGDELARVVGYYETGAHGVLVTNLPDGGEVLVPLVDEHVQLHLEDGEVLVPHFEDFIA